MVQRYIDEKLIYSYIARLSSLGLADKNVDYGNITQILIKLSKQCYAQEVFYSNLQVITIILFLNMLYKDGYVYFSDNRISLCPDVFLNETVMEVSLDVIDARGFKDEEIVKFIQEQNTDPNLLYYQSFNTTSSLRRRMKVLAATDDYQKDTFIFLGDDELFSVYFSFLNPGKKVTVLDIDDAIIKKIEKANIRFSLNIEARVVNILEGLPTDLCNRFDAFFASGLKDYGGLSAFIFAGLLSLKRSDKSVGYITFYDYNRSDNFNYQHQLQKLLFSHNCYFDLLVPCDQSIIPPQLINQVEKLVKNNSLETTYQSMKEDIYTSLRQGSPFAADPNFPEFSIRPINLGRIRHCSLDKDRIYRILHMIKRV